MLRVHTKSECPLVLGTLGGEECDKVKRWGAKGRAGK